LVKQEHLAKARSITNEDEAFNFDMSLPILNEADATDKILGDSYWTYLFNVKEIERATSIEM